MCRIRTPAGYWFGCATIRLVPGEHGRRQHTSRSPMGVELRLQKYTASVSGKNIAVVLYGRGDGGGELCCCIRARVCSYHEVRPDHVKSTIRCVVRAWSFICSRERALVFVSGFN